MASTLVWRRARFVSSCSEYSEAVSVRLDNLDYSQLGEAGGHLKRNIIPNVHDKVVIGNPLGAID